MAWTRLELERPFWCLAKHFGGAFALIGKAQALGRAEAPPARATVRASWVGRCLFRDRAGGNPRQSIGNYFGSAGFEMPRATVRMPPLKWPEGIDPRSV